MDILHRSWQRAWSAISANGDGGLLMEKLVSRYGEPHRKYHTLQHLRECIETVEPELSGAQHPGEIEMALWFHDAIYDVDAQDNEIRSASLAVTSLQAARVPQAATTRIRELIVATTLGVAPQTVDQKLMVDVDLSILGATEARFEEYEGQIRQESAWVPTWIFQRKRRTVLGNVLAQPAIYATEKFRNALEAQARENIRLAISRMSSIA